MFFRIVCAYVAVWRQSYRLENLSTSRMSSSSSSSRSSSLPSSESLPTSTSVARNTGGRKRSIRFDLSMDLTLLRQAISQSDLFHRGSPAIEQIASELAHHDQQRFQGLSRKAVRDRIPLLVAPQAGGFCPKTVSSTGLRGVKGRAVLSLGASSSCVPCLPAYVRACLCCPLVSLFVRSSQCLSVRSPVCLDLPI